MCCDNSFDKMHPDDMVDPEGALLFGSSRELSRIWQVGCKGMDNIDDKLEVKEPALEEK